MEIKDAIEKLTLLQKSILRNCITIDELEKNLIYTDALELAIETLIMAKHYKNIPRVIEIQMYKELLQPFCDSVPIFDNGRGSVADFKDIKFVGLDDDVELKINQCKYIYSDGSIKIFNLFDE